MGASGSGKTTIGQYLISLGIPEIISHTTRKIRKGEKHGVTYYFVTKEEFDRIEKIEEVTYNGNHYCISKNEIEKKLGNNNKVFVICDVNGMRQLKKFYPKEVVVIYIYTSFEEMERRMRLRGDSEESIRKRLEYAKETNELDNGKYADFIVRNDDFEKTKEQIKQIIYDVTKLNR